MWINFKSPGPFRIRIHVGDFNAITGKPSTSLQESMSSVNKPLYHPQNSQDYLVSGKQQYLDGMKRADGKVIQFVSTLVKSDYCVEANLSGMKPDTIPTLRFEITPVRKVSASIVGPAQSKPVQIFVKLAGFKTITLEVSLDITIYELLDLIVYAFLVQFNVKTCSDGIRVICGRDVLFCPMPSKHSKHSF